MNKIDVTAECSFTYGAQKKQAFTTKPKSIVCKSVKDNVPCAYGTKCIFTHYVDEVQPNACTFGYDCALVKYKGDNVKNKNAKKTCFFIHPEETVSDWLLRNGFDESLMQRPVQDPALFKCTRMCISVIENIPCTKGEECTYAHSPEELNTNPCNFGNECRHVRKEGDGYINNDTGKICIFLHPDESLHNFEARALRPLVKATKAKDTKDTKNEVMSNDMDLFPALNGIEVANTQVETEAIAPVQAETIPAQVDPIPVQDRIFLSVPHHMASEMLDMLLKSGKTNIQLNIY
jgi:hypothetical protein